MLTTLLMFCVGLSSCSKDDKDDDASVSIIGNWKCYYNEYHGQIFTGDDMDVYPYLIIEENFMGFNDMPVMPTVNSYGEKYKYTYDANSKVINGIGVDLDTNEPAEYDKPFTITITKLTSSDLEFEWYPDGDLEILKFKKYK